MLPCHMTPVKGATVLRLATRSPDSRHRPRGRREPGGGQRPPRAPCRGGIAQLVEHRLIREVRPGRLNGLRPAGGSRPAGRRPPRRPSRPRRRRPRPGPPGPARGWPGARSRSISSASSACSERIWTRSSSTEGWPLGGGVDQLGVVEQLDPRLEPRAAVLVRRRDAELLHAKRRGGCGVVRAQRSRGIRPRVLLTERAALPLEVLRHEEDLPHGRPALTSLPEFEHRFARSG